MINITEINLSGFNSDNTITDMKYMFYNCTSLKSIIFAGFNTSNVEYTKLAFASLATAFANNVFPQSGWLYNNTPATFDIPT